MKYFITEALRLSAIAIQNTGLGLEAYVAIIANTVGFLLCI
jgi:hypothetical protein